MGKSASALLAGLVVLISLIYVANSANMLALSHLPVGGGLKEKFFHSNYTRTPRGSEYQIGNLTVYRGVPWNRSDWPPSNPEEFDHWLENVATWNIAKYDVLTVMNAFSSRENITEVAIFGMCWGGKISTLAATELDGIEAAALVHPTFVENSEADGVRAPMYLLPASNDPDMLPFYEVLQEKFGNNSGHRRFDDMRHGFAGAGGNFSDPLTRQRVDEVIDILGTFFDRNLPQ